MAKKNLQLQHILRITVVIAPEKINAGEMVQISAVVTDRQGVPVIVPSLYMQIVDSKGREYWPLLPIARGVSSFSKMISTNEMKKNTRYTVRVSTNRELSPQGYAFFQTSKKKIPLAFIPTLLLPSILIPKKIINQYTPKIKIDRSGDPAAPLDEYEIIDKIPERLAPIEKPSDNPFWLVYTTELDAKVCDICKPHEGKKFRFNDPDIIRIGPPELGGETHYNCRCNYDVKLITNPALARVQIQMRAIGVVMAIQAVNKYKNKRRLTV